MKRRQEARVNSILSLLCIPFTLPFPISTFRFLQFIFVRFVFFSSFSSSFSAAVHLRYIALQRTYFNMWREVSEQTFSQRTHAFIPVRRMGHLTESCILLSCVLLLFLVSW